jgi:hypothetical protein
MPKIVGVNSTEFAWVNLAVTAMGRTFEGVTEVEYDLEVEKKQIYGRGGKVRGIQRGNEKPTASLTLRQSEVEAIVRAAQAVNPLAKPTDITFDVQVTYIAIGSTDIVKDRLVGCEFTKITKAFKQGDSEMLVKLPMLCLDIEYNRA